MSFNKEFEDETIEGEFAEEQKDQNPRSTLEDMILAGEWQMLTKNDVYKGRSRSAKIIAMHQAISNRIKELEKLFYPLVRNYPEKAQKLLDEIKKLRSLKDYLLQAYVWDRQGTFTEDDIPEELKKLL